MTTVVADREAMVADSLANNGNGLTYTIKKIHRVSNDKVGKALIAGTGGIFDCMAFVEWYRNGADRNNIPRYENDNMVALVLTTSGLFLYDWQGVGVKLEDGEHAIGTGATIAMAALRSGMSLVEAVEMAASVDMYTGGRIQVERLLRV